MENDLKISLYMNRRGLCISLTMPGWQVLPPPQQPQNWPSSNSRVSQSLISPESNPAQCQWACPNLSLNNFSVDGLAVGLPCREALSHSGMAKMMQVRMFPRESISSWPMPKMAALWQTVKLL